MGADDQRVLLASDAGYGFVARLEDLASKNKAGKALLTLPENSQVLPPQFVIDPTKALLAAVSNDGRLLVFPVTELPELARGKGNKIMNIPSARAVTEQAQKFRAADVGKREEMAGRHGPLTRQGSARMAEWSLVVPGYGGKLSEGHTATR
jgi:DNA gyrase/topoisomerase IV subunit A